MNTGNCSFQDTHVSEPIFLVSLHMVYYIQYVILYSNFVRNIGESAGTIGSIPLDNHTHAEVSYSAYCFIIK